MSKLVGKFNTLTLSSDQTMPSDKLRVIGEWTDELREALKSGRNSEGDLFVALDCIDWLFDLVSNGGRDHTAYPSCADELVFKAITDPKGADDE